VKLAHRFPGVVKDEEMDLLQEQFTDYILASKDDLPTMLKNSGTI
jgi:hypothetical protein